MVTYTNFLRNEASPSEPFAAPARALADALAALEDQLADAPVLGTPAPGATRRFLAERYDLSRPRALEEVASDLYDLLASGIVHSNHRRHFGLFVPGVRAAGVVGDALAALLNPQVGSWWYAPAACEIESHVLDALAERIGFDPAAGAAHFTSGGSEANATAVILALTRAFPQIREEGLLALPGRPVLYASEAAHDSFVKIAHQTGLGRAAVHRIRTSSDDRLDLDDLRRRHQRDRERGDLPFLVVGTAGTTASGAFDPLPELAAFARESSLWLHVDAAWGGLALLVEELRPLVAGIERADSVTWDAHKVFPIPTGAGMFFARERSELPRAFGVETGYVPHPVAGTVDLYQESLQWSRRCIGLKVFCTLAELGWEGVAAMLRHQVAMGNALRDLLVAAGFEVVNRSALPLVCFTHPKIREGAQTAEGVVKELLARGKAWISSVQLAPGEPKALRACITHHHTDEADLRVLVEEVEAALRGSGAR